MSHFLSNTILSATLVAFAYGCASSPPVTNAEGDRPAADTVAEFEMVSSEPSSNADEAALPESTVPVAAPITENSSELPGPSEPAASPPISIPSEVDSPTGQIRCRAVINADTETQAIAVGLEFVYPQLRTGEYLNVQIKSPEFDDEPDFQKAWFSTAGEDSHWTLPSVMGVAPVVITLFAAPRDPVNDRFVAGFHSYPAVPVECAPL